MMQSTNTLSNTKKLKKKSFDNILSTAMKLKRVMKKKNLRRARAECPFCVDGMLYGSIDGHKQHLHMRCDKCKIVFME